MSANKPSKVRTTLRRPKETNDASQTLDRKKQKKAGWIRRTEPENDDSREPAGEEGNASKGKSKSKKPTKDKLNVEEPSTFEPNDRTKPEDSSGVLKYRPATFTGFRELPIAKAFVILLLWLPRFFIPWITAWHEFDVYILSNPWHWEAREDDLRRHQTYVLAGKSVIAILCSVTVDLVRYRKKWELEFAFFQVLLMLFTLCPLVGGMVDAVLRAAFYEEHFYTEWWFTSVVLMQWAMSVAFMMFPVQFTCIYRQHNKMSRNAHYNWSTVFVILEFINAYVAFLVIPGPCPTPPWIQIVVWTALFLLMVTTTMLTLIFLLASRALKYAMLICCNRKTESEEGEYEPFIDAPSEVKTRKLMWLSIIIVPVICSYFSFSVLQHFVSKNHWDQHHFLSITSFFLLAKIIGVVLTALAMFIIRKVYRKRNPTSLKAEMMFLGLPHCLNVLALVIMAGRLAVLSHPKETDIIVGPIPDEDKAVLVFVNTMFRNMTICISSNYFQPVKIRPYEYVTKEVYDTGMGPFTVTMEVEPCFEPRITKTLRLENIKKGEWKIVKIALLSANFTNLETWDYYRTLVWNTLRDIGELRPEVGAPLMMILQWRWIQPEKHYYYEMNHTTLGTVAVKINSTDTYGVRNRIVWEVPAIGKWTVRLWNYLYNVSEAIQAWVKNCSQCVTPLEFTIENNSLYLLVEYGYEETSDVIISDSFFTKGLPPSAPQFPMSPGSYLLVKLAEIAGPDSNRLPNTEYLQKDWAVKMAAVLAGMAAGGTFLGFVYLFWVDPPWPPYRTITVAVCWVLMGVASEIPRIQMIEVDVKVSLVLLCLQIAMTALHFFGAFYMYTPKFNLRIRPD